MKTKTGFEYGFTLIELLIVCLLISISLAVTIPSLKLPGLTDDLGSDARKIISLIREVKSKAIADQQPYLLHFNTGDNKIWYEKEKVAGVEKQEEKSLEKEDVINLILTESVHLEDVLMRPENLSESSNMILRINEQGYSKQTVIQLSNEHGEYLSLEIAPFAAEIKLHETLFTLN